MENGKTRMERLEELLKDLIWLNGVIATELIRITENTASILMGRDAVSPCPNTRK